MSGRVVHFEIPYDDGERARLFYNEVFGWEMTELPEMSYTLVTSGPSGAEGPDEPGFINGGMMPRREPFTSPNLVLDVESIEVALQAVNDAGGTIVSEREQVGEMGFAAYFKDTEGNLVGLWESASQG
ncbi:MAG TPA: VOC family protein [Acidimicrobiia bacterium]